MFETKLDIFVAGVLPYPYIALSPPYAVAAKAYLAVPTPVVSLATTPELLTKLLSETGLLV